MLGDDVHSRSTTAGQSYVRTGLFDPNGHAAAGLGELDRVVEQVREQLPIRDGSPVIWSGAGPSQLSVTSRSSASTWYISATSAIRAVRLIVLAPQLDLASVGPRQEQESVDESRQAITLLAERAQGVAILGGAARPLQGHLDRPRHRGQRLRSSCEASAVNRVTWL